MEEIPKYVSVRSTEDSVRIYRITGKGKVISWGDTPEPVSYTHLRRFDLMPEMGETRRWKQQNHQSSARMPETGQSYTLHAYSCLLYTSRCV